MMQQQFLGIQQPLALSRSQSKFEKIDTSKLKKQSLTHEEMRKIEYHQQIYVIIRQLDFIEKYYILDKIPQQEYNYIENVTKLLNSYEGLKKQIPNFNLNQFMNEYGLKECTWAEERINKGPPEKSQNEAVLFVQITNKFHQMSDTLYLNQTKPSVSFLKPDLEDLIMCLKQAGNLLKKNNFSGISQLETALNAISQKGINDVLDQNEFDQLQAIVDITMKDFQRFINSQNK